MSLQNKENNGVYYFLGSIPSHGLHALPLYSKIGGTFVVTSQKALDTISAYGVKAIMLEDRPDINLNFGYNIPKTIRFLNKHAKVVLFYEIYGFPIGMRLTKPKTLFLTHGNILKQYLSPKRITALKQYDYMVGLGPYNHHKFQIEYSIPASKLLPLGIARTDDVVANRGKITGADSLIDLLSLVPNQPIITYMPTYWGASSVHNVGKEILRNIPDSYNLIFRPHPQTPERIIYEYLGIIDAKPGNVVYAPEGKFKEATLIRMYEASSAIIGDISSVMLEAILIDKPLLFAYDTGGHRQTEKDVESIKDVVDYSAHIDIESVRSLPYILENALARGVDSSIWETTKDYTFFHHDGTSVASIAQFIKKLL
ncbi:MAG TPA: CDP-glycerol glycerophosphotransferase family protein [Candidatus Saccharimonadales bacterium]